MTTIVNKYIGITHPIDGGDNQDIILKAWKIANCPQGVHCFDEVWSNENHYLHCDACGLEVHIKEVVVPDGKDIIIDNSIVGVKPKI